MWWPFFSEFSVPRSHGWCCFRANAPWSSSWTFFLGRQGAWLCWSWETGYMWGQDDRRNFGQRTGLSCYIMVQSRSLERTLTLWESEQLLSSTRLCTGTLVCPQKNLPSWFYKEKMGKKILDYSNISLINSINGINIIKIFYFLHIKNKSRISS